MSANSEACCGLAIGMPDDTMYASPIVSTWTTILYGINKQVLGKTTVLTYIFAIKYGLQRNSWTADISSAYDWGANLVQEVFA